MTAAGRLLTVSPSSGTSLQILSRGEPTNLSRVIFARDKSLPINQTYQFICTSLKHAEIQWSVLFARRVAVISAKNHKHQRRKRQSLTAKREKSQTPKVSTAILTLPNLI